MSYAELAVTTNFSFLRGASHPQEFVTQAQALGYAAIGIADRNSLAGVVRAYGEWKEMEGTRPQLLVGARLVFRDGTPDILAYPKNRKAYGRLSRLLSIGKLRAQKGECLLDFTDLLDYRRGLLLIVVPPPSQLGLASQAPRCDTSPRSSLRSRGEEAGGSGGSRRDVRRSSLTEILTRLGGDTWLAASMLYTGEDRRRLRDLARLARAARVPLIAVNDVLYH
ncbi:MAG TPA: PHP domain-containing protein, partial [Rhizomicrobium sp.]|nr:PHP domain-containing protein [Rhizomicrobium sp.]